MVTPRPVRKLVDELVEKRAGYRVVMSSSAGTRARRQLGAYRLSGPLAPIVWGVHLKRDFRLAFTIQSPDEPEGPTRVVILYVGQREPRHRESDVSTVLHDLFESRIRRRTICDHPAAKMASRESARLNSTLSSTSCNA